ncbi:MAG: hypothetical protein Q4G69_00535 [Planctomycetia bacterium]|nr:hypothetical protein [Planctomycetia bacterium]
MKTQLFQSGFQGRSALLISIGLFFLLFSLSGCKSVKLPNTLRENPNLADIEQAVNQNSQRIQTLRSDDVSVGVNNMAGWAKCQMAFERPCRVRMIATVSMKGRVLDCGANDDLFWFWSKFQTPEQLAWCKLNESGNALTLTQNIPIEPTWFPEAMGIVEFKPGEIIEGPIVQPDKTLLLVSKKSRPDGQYTKHTYIEPLTAAVKKQELFDPGGNPIISVHCTEFQYNDVNNVVLPRKIVITSPQRKESIHFDLGTIAVNAPGSINEQLFVMPQAADLGNPPVVNLRNGGSINLPTAVQNTVGTPTASAPRPVNKIAAVPPQNRSVPVANSVPVNSSAIPPFNPSGSVPAANGTSLQMSTGIPVPVSRQGAPSVSSPTESTAHLRTQVSSAN